MKSKFLVVDGNSLMHHIENHIPREVDSNQRFYACNYMIQNLIQDRKYEYVCCVCTDREYQFSAFFQPNQINKVEKKVNDFETLFTEIDRILTNIKDIDYSEKITVIKEHLKEIR